MPLGSCRWSPAECMQPSEAPESCPSSTAAHGRLRESTNSSFRAAQSRKGALLDGLVVEFVRLTTQLTHDSAILAHRLHLACHARRRVAGSPVVVRRHRTVTAIPDGRP